MLKAEQKYIKKLKPGYSYAYYGKNLTTAKTISSNENKVFGIGSIIKIPIAITLYKLYQSKKLDLDKTISISKYSKFDNGGRDAGILKLFPARSKITLRIAALLMLSISDNFATNVILESIKSKEVNRYINSLGFKKTKVNVPVINDYLFKKSKKDFGSSTANELGYILEGLVKNRFLDNNLSQDIVSFMGAPNSPSRSLRNLPVSKNTTHEIPEIAKSYSKGGTFPRLGTIADVSLIETQNNERLILAVLTNNFVQKGKETQRSSAIDHISSRFIADISSEIYSKLKNI